MSLKNQHESPLLTFPLIMTMLILDIQYPHRMVPIFDEELWKQVRKMIYDEWGDRDIDSRVTWVKECFQHRHNMTIFRLDGGGSNDIDVAILQALLKG